MFWSSISINQRSLNNSIIAPCFQLYSKLNLYSCSEITGRFFVFLFTFSTCHYALKWFLWSAGVAKMAWAPQVEHVNTFSSVFVVSAFSGFFFPFFSCFSYLVSSSYSLAAFTMGSRALNCSSSRSFAASFTTTLIRTSTVTSSFFLHIKFNSLYLFGSMS